MFKVIASLGIIGLRFFMLSSEMVWDVDGVLPVLQFQASSNHRVSVSVGKTLITWCGIIAPEWNLPPSPPTSVGNDLWSKCTQIDQRLIKNTIEVFLLWKDAIRPLLKSIFLYGMTISVCTLLESAKDQFELLVYSYLKTACNMQDGKGRTLAGCQVQFPKSTLQKNFYLKKDFATAESAQSCLSQIIITKPTQTKKLKIGKPAMWSFFLYLFSLIHEICCMHKPVHSNRASEHEHRLKRKTTKNKTFHPTRSKLQLLGPPFCLWLRPLAHRLS